MEDIKLVSEEDKIREELEALHDLTKTDGWFFLAKWLSDERDVINRQIYEAPLDQIDKLRGDARRIQKIFDHINHSIKTLKEI